MRLNNYLTEFKVIKMEDTLTLLKRNCSEYIRELRSGKNFFIRENNKFVIYSEDDVILLPPREDRAPRDMNPYLHNEMNNLLKAKFGWKPRSEGLFVWVTPQNKNFKRNSFEETEKRLIFPTDGYKYVYSKSIFDIFYEYERIEDELYDISDNYTPEELNEKFLNWFTKEALPTYTDKNVLKANFPLIETECSLRTTKAFVIAQVNIPLLNNTFNLNIKPVRDYQ